MGIQVSVNGNEETDLLLGSDLKLMLYIKIYDVNLDIVNFDVTFKIGNKSLTLNKSSLIEVDENNFIACIKASDTEVGNLIIEYTFEIPDEDFPDNILIQKKRINTNIKIHN